MLKRHAFRDIPEALTAEVRIPVTFDLLDPMNVVYHGNYARFFEAARSALMRSLDYDYLQMKESGFAWPVTDLQVRYAEPARLGDMLVVRAGLIEDESKLSVAYEIRREADGALLTRGRTDQMGVEVLTGTSVWSLPACLTERIAAKKGVLPA